MFAEHATPVVNHTLSNHYTHVTPTSSGTRTRHHFTSREEAGKILARLLKYYANQPDVVVLSIKPTATLLAHEIARGLNLPLDLFLIRLLKVDEMTVGAVTDRTDKPLLKDLIIRGCGITQEKLDEIINQERSHLETLKSQLCPNNLPYPSSGNATILLTTDGIQSGQDARAALTLLREMGYRGRAVLVGGVIGSDAQKSFMREFDDVVAVKGPQIVGNVGSWYQKNEELSNEQIKTILKEYSN